jgi:hypothetical protein
MNNTLLSQHDRELIAKVTPLAYEQGRSDGFEDGVRIATREAYAKFGAVHFSEASEQQKPLQFPQVFRDHQFDEAFNLYYSEENYPEGLPRYVPKFFGMTPEDFEKRTGLELFQVYADPTDEEKFVCRWLHPSKIQELPPREETFAAGHATNPNLRRVQITDKNGVRTWRYINPDKGKPNPDKSRIGTGGGTAERTEHPLNRARRTADYHPTQVAAQAVHEAFANPAALHTDQISTLAEHLEVLRKPELKELNRQIQSKLSGPKKELVNRLLIHIRKQMDEHKKRQQPATSAGPAGVGQATPPVSSTPPARTISPDEHRTRLEAKRAEIAQKNHAELVRRGKVWATKQAQLHSNKIASYFGIRSAKAFSTLHHSISLAMERAAEKGQSSVLIRDKSGRMLRVTVKRKQPSRGI